MCFDWRWRLYREEKLKRVRPDRMKKSTSVVMNDPLPLPQKK